jgi:hypothetical protein
VNVDAFGHLDLGSRDPEKAYGVVAGERAGFFSVDYVIRDRGDLRRAFRLWAECAKSLNDGHNVPPYMIVKITVGWGNLTFY